jgi:hypothetical protein
MKLTCRIQATLQFERHPPCSFHHCADCVSERPCPPLIVLAVLCQAEGPLAETNDDT